MLWLFLSPVKFPVRILKHGRRFEGESPLVDHPRTLSIAVQEWDSVVVTLKGGEPAAHQQLPTKLLTQLGGNPPNGHNLPSLSP